MAKILIADDVVSECARILSDGGLEVDDRGRMSVEELEGAIDGYQGLVVRSGVKVTKNVIEAGRSLQVIGPACSVGSGRRSESTGSTSHRWNSVAVDGVSGPWWF